MPTPWFPHRSSNFRSAQRHSARRHGAQRHSARRHGAQRRGAALVEFAVCLPILALLVFGTIEATSFVFLKESLQVAAHQGALAASRMAGTTARGQQAAEAILQSREVRGSEIRFPEGDADRLARGEPVTIEIHANSRPNSPLLGPFIPNRQLVSRVTMIKE